MAMAEQIRWAASTTGCETRKYLDADGHQTSDFGRGVRGRESHERIPKEEREHLELGAHHAPYTGLVGQAWLAVGCMELALHLLSVFASLGFVKTFKPPTSVSAVVIAEAAEVCLLEHYLWTARE
jgi:hypothetical protein